MMIKGTCLSCARSKNGVVHGFIRGDHSVSLDYNLRTLLIVLESYQGLEPFDELLNHYAGNFCSPCCKELVVVRRGQRARLHESRRPKLGFFRLRMKLNSKSVIMSKSNTLSSWIQPRMRNVPNDGLREMGVINYIYAKDV